MYKIAVLGDRESVMGFKALGLEVFPAESAEEAQTTLRALAKDPQWAIIYLTEQLAEQLSEEIDRYKESLTPAIILFPGKGGSLGIGMQNITTSVERAVGADIL